MAAMRQLHSKTSKSAAEIEILPAPVPNVDGEYDEEMEKEASSQHMCELRKRLGVNTKEELDRIAEEARDNPPLPAFTDNEEMLKHLHELVEN